MTRAELEALADKIERKRVLYGDARLYYPQGHDPLALEAVNALRALAQEKADE